MRGETSVKKMLVRDKKRKYLKILRRESSNMVLWFEVCKLIKASEKQIARGVEITLCE